jgi:hypothetical protein
MTVIADVDTGAVVFVDPDDPVVATPRQHIPGPAIVGFDEHYAVRGLTPLPGRPMTSTWLDDDAVVRLRDEETGRTVRHSSPVSPWYGHPDDDRRLRLRTEVRPIDIDCYVAGVAELRDLFTTSVRTGRPVYWV